MAIATLMLIANCAMPTFYNDTNTWYAVDMKTLQIAINRCGEIYPNSPCMDFFRKREEGVYWAVCKAKDFKQPEQKIIELKRKL